MSFQQLRDWLSDCWQNFWKVSASQIVAIVCVILWAILTGLWRSGYRFGGIGSPGYAVVWSLRIALGFGVLWVLRRSFNR